MQGKLIKYKDKIVKALIEDQTETTADLLISVFLESMEEVCERCMSNRMMCTLRPECSNRIFLNLLIKFGVDVKDLPSFCYEQQVNRINMFLEGSAKTKIVDAALPIREFIKILTGGVGEKFTNILQSGNIEKLSKQLFNELKRVTPEVLISVGNDYILALVDDGLYYFDLSNEIVIINPQEESIKSKDILSGLIDIYKERYKIALELREEFEGLWYLDIFIPVKNPKNGGREEINKILEEYEKRLSSTSYVSSHFSNNKINLTIEVRPPIFQQKNNLTFKTVTNIFTEINNLMKEIKQLPKT
ncbi:MAG: hypothetical protein QW279_12590 [Candidatus Jordarchaeaceae archaeon]